VSERVCHRRLGRERRCLPLQQHRAYQAPGSDDGMLTTPFRHTGKHAQLPTSKISVSLSQLLEKKRDLDFSNFFATYRCSTATMYC